MKTILTLSHTDYTQSVGGTEKVILEQNALYRDAGYDTVHLCPLSNSIKIKGRTAYSFKTGYRVIKNNECVLDNVCFANVVEFLQNEDVCQIFIHMLTGFDFGDVINLLNTYSGVKTIFYIHDYKTVCTGQVLLKNKNYYCGDDGRFFRKCWNCRFYWEGIGLFKNCLKLVNRYPNIIYVFPSEAARSIWSKNYRSVGRERLLVIPHQVMTGKEMIPEHRNDKLRIAYVGYKSFNKGWSAFRELVMFDETYNNEYYVLGKTDEQLPDVKVIPVSFIDEGPDAMVKALASNKIDVALLWSTWPETYSYTFYESYVAGCYIITNVNSGNIAVATQKLKCGIALPSIRELKQYVISGQLMADVKGDVLPRKSKLDINKTMMLDLINA